MKIATLAIGLSLAASGAAVFNSVRIYRHDHERPADRCRRICRDELDTDKEEARCLLGCAVSMLDLELEPPRAKERTTW